jgi:flagellar FliL protein
MERSHLFLTGEDRVMAEQIAGENDKSGKKEAASKFPLNTTNLLLLIVLAILMLLIVGGALATIVIYRSTNHPAAVAQQPADAAATEGDKAKTGEKKPKEAKEAKKEKDTGPKAPPIYVTLEPPFVVNFTAGKPAKFLQITMEIMTRDQATAQTLKDINPLLRNDLLMLYGAQEYETMASPDGREALRQKALETVRNVAKKEGGKAAEVEAVYFTSLVMQ